MTAAKDSRDNEIDKMATIIENFKQERIAAQRAATAKEERERADAAMKVYKELEESRKKDEISLATKKAKEAAEEAANEKAKKAKDEHEKAIEVAKKKAEELEKSKKALEEEVKKHKGTPDDAKAPIKFKDAVGRKFSFPWRICKTWKVGYHSLSSHRLFWTFS